MRILWVENHPLFARYAGREFLRDHTVVVVASLAAARAAVAVESFDVLLIDYDLDDGKGDVLVREARQLQRRTAIVATSAHEAGNDALVGAGADAACGKLEFGRIGDVLKSLTTGASER
ncbi:MAG TPA: response regulator [Gemmataceae bacterium]|nr:response regulator [Gemmataceae bacterium]